MLFLPRNKIINYSVQVNNESIVEIELSKQKGVADGASK